MEVEAILKRKYVFNPDGDSDISARKLINGNTTNLIEINNIKYQWAYNLYKVMAFSNFWIPQEIPMIDDRKQYETKLTDAERRAYKLVLSFLIALDSFQVEWLAELKRFVTAPEITLSLTAQEFQEGLHSFSYQYILESVVDPLEADEVYNLWRQDQMLYERNAAVVSLYNDYIDDPDLHNFARAIIANYALESLYFYSGFAFFYILGRQGKVLNTVQQIKYINRDEYTHITLFKHIIDALKTEYPSLFAKNGPLYNWTREFFKDAAYQEIKWGQYVTNNNILGLTNELIDQYIKYLADKRLAQIGFEPVFGVDKNPMEWIDTFRQVNSTKTDFFTKKPQTYAKANELKW